MMYENEIECPPVVLLAGVDTGEYDMETPLEELRELAALRLENPEASLRELGAKLGLSRSGVNHRLKKIAELATERNQTP